MNATTSATNNPTPRTAPPTWRGTAPSATRPANDAEPPAASPFHLLIVDDDLGTIEHLGQLLKGFAQVSFATNGEDALRLATQHSPDLVLLDVELPGIGGFEVCRRLRATPALRGVPIVFATSHVDAETEVRALQLGADDFLRKPFDDVQVLSRLRTRLREAAAQDHEAAVNAAEPTRILIIDDDPISIQLVRRLLGEVGECHFALNGAQALTLASELRPDLVLLDIDLPDGDGYRVCKKLRADPVLGQVPIMFLTQSGTVGHEARALALGGDDFLRKPFSAPVLRARVNRLVGRARQRPPATAPASDPTVPMLAYLAHEIGNPVNVIKGFTQLLQGESLSTRQADMLSHILDAVDRLAGLMTDMSDVARLESGQFRVQLADVELHSLARQACEQAAAQARAADMQLTSPQPQSAVHVKADERRLRQCLDNLLSNAIKYGRDGRRIDVGIEARGAEVALTVQDHGAGLDEEQLAHLFEPYNRLGQDGGPIPGTGLGLMLTRDLVQAMGGRLLVQSRPGQGCRFELLLQAGKLPNAPG